MSLSVLIGTCPSCTAVSSAGPKYVPGVMFISMSSPFSADATVEWVAPQSETTNPVKPNWLSSMPLSVCGFSHEYTLLMRLYEHITPMAPP